MKYINCATTLTTIMCAIAAFGALAYYVKFALTVIENVGK